jgi:hypothetical protein
MEKPKPGTKAWIEVTLDTDEEVQKSAGAEHVYVLLPDQPEYNPCLVPITALMYRHEPTALQKLWKDVQLSTDNIARAYKPPVGDVPPAAAEKAPPGTFNPLDHDT